MDDVNDISLLTLGQETPSEALTSSLTRLIAKLQDNSLSEDDFINTLEELAELEVTVPALLETGAGIVVRRLEKMKEGKVAKMARNLVIKWKRVAIEHESPVDNLDVQFRQQLNNM